MKFAKWLRTLLQQDELEIRRLLNDQTALHFLIAWSLFESKCFSGFIKIDRIEAFARNAVADGFDSGSIRDAATHFHARYQDGDRYRQLMHSQKCPRMDALLQRKVQTFSPEESLFFVTLIVYRFRNNMFHGNKKSSRGCSTRSRSVSIPMRWSSSSLMPRLDARAFQSGEWHRSQTRRGLTSVCSRRRPVRS